MPIDRVADTELGYHLIGFDAVGRERTDDPDGPMGRRAADQVARDGITDVFLLAHGWQGDVPAASRQYHRWLKAALQCSADLARLKERQGGFRPLVIGLHWPSLPWGDEEFGPGTDMPTDVGAPSDEQLVELYAERIADTPAARAALQQVVSAASAAATPRELPPDVRAAYITLNREAELGAQGLGAPPGADRDPIGGEAFDPDRVYEDAAGITAQAFGLGGSSRDLLLAPLRQLSFWKMKDRARKMGETGVHELLKALAAARVEARLHLMGHSFGCIVTSAAVAGPAGSAGLIRPVHSLTLLQGAMSLWSYCDDIPYLPAVAGYFRQVAEGRVAGPVIVTRSRFDNAVGRWYPLGVRLARQVAFAPTPFPRYGATGTFGLRGPGLDLAPDGPLLAADGEYEFKVGRVYNLDASHVIREGGGASGAHNDIAHPEVAHLVWAAALATGEARAATPASLSAAVPAVAAPVAVADAMAALVRAAAQAAAALKTPVRIEIEIDPSTS